MKRLLSRAAQLFTLLLLLLAAFAGGFLLRPRFDAAQFPKEVSVTGTVQRMVYSPELSSAPPEGWYVEGSAVARIYVQCVEAEPREGTDISVRGTLDSVCGTGVPCYPRVTGQCYER